MAQESTKKIKVGDAAPTIASVPSIVGEAESTVSLSDYVGQLVVIYFYPKDDTPTCTLQGHEYSKALATFEKAKCVVFGASKDSAASHKSFSCGQSYTVPLIAETDTCKFVDEYTRGHGARTTFLIDAEGKINQIYPLKGVKDMAGHVAQVLADVEKLTKTT